MRHVADIIKRILLCLTLLSVGPVASADVDPEAGRYPSSPIVLPSDSGYFRVSHTADATLWGFPAGNGQTYGRDIYYIVTLPERMSLIVHTIGSQLPCTNIQLYGPGYSTVFRAKDKIEYASYYRDNYGWNDITQTVTQDCYIAFDCQPGTYEIRTRGEKVYNANAVNGPITLTVIGFADDIPSYPGVPPSFIPGTLEHPFPLLGRAEWRGDTTIVSETFSDGFFTARGYERGGGKTYYTFSNTRTQNIDIITPSHESRLYISGDSLPLRRLVKSPLSCFDCKPGKYLIEVQNALPFANFALRLWDWPPAPDYDLYQPFSTCNKAIIGKNFVSTRTMLDSTATAYVEEIAHVDGLGRPVQSVAVDASPSGGSIVSATTYDLAGRPEKAWIPGMATLEGAYALTIDYGANSVTEEIPDTPVTPVKPPLLDEPEWPPLLPPIFPPEPVTPVTPSGPQAYYSLTEYEPSQLQRPIRKYAPSLSGHSADTAVNYEYALNHGSGMWNCIGFEAHGTDDIATVGCSPRSDGSIYYAPGELTVTRTTDEDGHTTYEFRDVYDRTVLLRRVLDGGIPADTYYCYDSYGNLVAVLPPEASTRITGPTIMAAGHSEILDDYCYVYTYDARGRQLSKKMPGCGKVFNIYDGTDRLIAWQDGNLRARRLWRFVIADAFGRPCLSGTCSSIELSSASSAVRACRDEAGELAGYRVTGATLTDARILTANYYDDYSFIGNYGVPASVAFTSAGDPDTRCSDVRGKLTGTMTAVGAEADSLLIPSAGYLCTALYYDIRDRVIQSVSTNHLGGVDRTVTTYDFAGHPLLTQTTHTTAADPQGIVQQLQRTYDSQGRPLDVSHRTGREGGWTSLSLTSYDRLGRPASERRGSLESAVTEYSYDLRSRLVSMTSTLYSQSLAYTAAGNIASLTWTTHGSPQRTYRYGYDSLSRLTRARYSDSEGGAGRYDTRYSYDLNGNLTSLVRRGALSLSSAGTPSIYGAIDSLTLEYAGNRLRSVSDAAAGPHYQGAFHFVDGADEDEEYRYDLNGNTVTDLNRGILSSRFDTAGHPARMDFADGSSTSYLYDDAGTKLRTLHRVASVPVAVPGSQGPALTETVTDYCAGFVYEDSLLTRINLDGAYLSYTGADGSRLSTPEYHFYLRDHLGNNRVDVAADGRICQMTDYYPYGLPMASSRNLASQRWLFGGKELDRISGLDLYDFEARAYDPALARFTSPDAFAEKYYSLSPYLYCAANPLRLIDPTGNVINIAKGTSTRDLYLVMGALQKLTNDKVEFSTQKDGSIRIKIASLGNGNKSAGTRLIRRINSSNKTMTINVISNDEGNYETDENSTNAINGSGTNVNVYFNPESDPDIPTLDKKTGRVVDEKRPSQVGLAHEMIHGDRSMRGSAIDYTEEESYTYTNSQGEKTTQSILKEEAATVGLNHVKKNDITENDIRKEQGLESRGAY